MGGQVFPFRLREQNLGVGSSAGSGVPAATTGARRTTPRTGAKTGIELLLLWLLAVPRRLVFVSRECRFLLEREFGAGRAHAGRAQIGSELTWCSTRPSNGVHDCSTHERGDNFADLHRSTTRTGHERRNFSSRSLACPPCLLLWVVWCLRKPVRDAGGATVKLLIVVRVPRIPGALERTSQIHCYETQFTQVFINCA